MIALLQFNSLVLAIALLTSCSTTKVIRPFLENAPGTAGAKKATAHFVIPSGWRGKYYDTDWKYYLGPVKKTQDYPSIAIGFSRLDPTEAATQKGQAKADLEAIHHHADDSVQSSEIGTIESPRYGKLILYYFRSGYYGQHYRVYIIEGFVRVAFDMTAETQPALQRYFPMLQKVVEGTVITNNHTKAEQGAAANP